MLGTALDTWGYRQALDLAGIAYDDPRVQVVWREGDDGPRQPVVADEGGRMVVAVRGAAGVEWRPAVDLPWLDLPEAV